MAIKKDNDKRKLRGRFKHLVHFELQFRYLIFIAIGMVVPLVIVSGVFFVVFWQAAATELAIPEGIAQFIIPALIRAAVVLLLLLPVVCVLILWAALIVSHRIAGPLVRLEDELKKMIETHKLHRLKIRKRDELAGLVEAINEIIHRSRKD